MRIDMENVFFWLKEGFSVYKNNLSLLVFTCILFLVGSIVTLGFLGPPLEAGLVIICLSLVRLEQPHPKPLNIFRGFQFFLPAFTFWIFWQFGVWLFMAVLSFLPLIGFPIALILGYIAWTFVMFGMFFIVDSKAGAIEATQKSVDIVKENLIPLFLMSFVLSVLSYLGSVVFLIGLFVTYPYQYCVLSVAYNEISS
jgi:hypothetical protein